MYNEQYETCLVQQWKTNSLNCAARLDNYKPHLGFAYTHTLMPKAKCSSHEFKAQEERRDVIAKRHMKQTVAVMVLLVLGDQSNRYGWDVEVYKRTYMKN